jgi:hypothetical protein
LVSLGTGGLIVTSGEPRRGGPFIKEAFFCERALEEKVGVISYIRVIDRVIHTVVGPDAPENLEPFNYHITLVIGLVAGDATGRSVLKLRIESPDGISKDLGHPIDMRWGQTHSAQRTVIRLELRFEDEGAYWVHVDVDGVERTAIPLEVNYSRTLPSRFGG